MALKNYADALADLGAEVIDLCRPLAEPLLARLVVWTRPLDLSGPWTVNPWGPDCVCWLLDHLPGPERKLYLMGFSVAELKRIRTAGFSAEEIAPIYYSQRGSVGYAQAVTALLSSDTWPAPIRSGPTFRHAMAARQVLASLWPPRKRRDRDD